MQNQVRSIENYIVREADLQHQLAGVKRKEHIVRIASKINDKSHLLLKLSTLHDKNIASKASWAYRTWAAMNRGKAKAMSGKVISAIKTIDYDPALRNLMGSILDTGCQDKYKVLLMDYCLQLLLQEKRAIAVHANAAGILSFIAKDHPELKPEIIITLSALPVKLTPAVRYRLKNLLRISTH